MDGYKAIAGWAKDLGTKARERLGCRIENRQRPVPSESIIRDVLMRVDPDALDRALVFDAQSTVHADGHGRISPEE